MRIIFHQMIYQESRKSKKNSNCKQNLNMRTTYAMFLLVGLRSLLLCHSLHGMFFGKVVLRILGKDLLGLLCCHCHAWWDSFCKCCLWWCGWWFWIGKVLWSCVLLVWKLREKKLNKQLQPWVKLWCKNIPELDSYDNTMYLFSEASHQAGILKKWFWLANCTLITSPAFYSKDHSLELFPGICSKAGKNKP